MIIFKNSESSFPESPGLRCSQGCRRCPQGGSLTDSTDDGAENFLSTNGLQRNWHSLRALTYSRWILDIWFPFPFFLNTVNAGSVAFLWDSLFDFLCSLFSINVSATKSNGNDAWHTGRQLLKRLAPIQGLFLAPHPQAPSLPSGFISRNTPCADIFTASSPKPASFHTLTTLLMSDTCPLVLLQTLPDQSPERGVLNPDPHNALPPLFYTSMTCLGATKWRHTCLCCNQHKQHEAF